MTQKSFDNFIKKNINSYRDLLIKDLDENKEFARVVNKLYFPSFDMSQLKLRLENLEIDSFDNFSVTPNEKYCDLSDIGEIEYNPTNINFDENPYMFFSYLEFNNYKDVEANFPTSYYVFSKDYFIKNVDILVLNGLNEYESDGQKFYKEVTKGVWLEVFFKRKQANFFSISDYYFPQIKIKFENTSYSFCEKTDLQMLLFLPTNSFYTFYSESILVFKDDLGRLIGNKIKDSEPVVYHFKEEEKYVITNSYEKLSKYNKYILITSNLFIHYFQIFERWVYSLNKNLDEYHS